MPRAQKPSRRALMTEYIDNTLKGRIPFPPFYMMEWGYFSVGKPSTWDHSSDYKEAHQTILNSLGVSEHDYASLYYGVDSYRVRLLHWQRDIRNNTLSLMSFSTEGQAREN